MWEPSLEAYTKALELLSDNNLPQAEKNIKRECELDIDHVKSQMMQKAPPNTVPSSDESDYPWDRVLRLEGVARARDKGGVFSSASYSRMRFAKILTLLEHH